MIRNRILMPLVLALAACASQPLIDTETIAMRSVTAARQVATASLRAGKITVAEDQKAQAQLSLVALGIKAAVAAQDAAAVAKAQADADKIKSDLESK